MTTDYSPLFPKLFELQKLNSRKTGLALRLDERRDLDARAEMAADLSAHKRDAHRQYWDHEMHLRYKRERDAETQTIRQDYKDVCRQITELEEQIESEIVAAAH